MLKNIHFWMLIFFILSACSSNLHEEVNPDESPVKLNEPTDNIYFNFRLKGLSYNVSRATHSLFNKGYDFLCANEYVSGITKFSLEDRSYAGFVTAVDFRVTKKVFRDKLYPGNELGYLSKVVNTDSIGFPINTNGYYEIYDLENEVFQVSRDVIAEAYLSITTKDQFYRSSSVVPNERDSGSFIRIVRVIENTGKDRYEYPYLLEGTFRVNLFEGMYGTTSQIVEGEFRWPMGRVENSQMLKLCTSP